MTCLTPVTVAFLVTPAFSRRAKTLLNDLSLSPSMASIQAHMPQKLRAIAP